MKRNALLVIAFAFFAGMVFMPLKEWLELHLSPGAGTAVVPAGAGSLVVLDQLSPPPRNRIRVVDPDGSVTWTELEESAYSMSPSDELLSFADGEDTALVWRDNDGVCRYSTCSHDREFCMTWGPDPILPPHRGTGSKIKLEHLAEQRLLVATVPHDLATAHRSQTGFFSTSGPSLTDFLRIRTDDTPENRSVTVLSHEVLNSHPVVMVDDLIVHPVHSWTEVYRVIRDGRGLLEVETLLGERDFGDPIGGAVEQVLSHVASQRNATEDGPFVMVFHLGDGRLMVILRWFVSTTLEEATLQPPTFDWGIIDSDQLVPLLDGRSSAADAGLTTLPTALGHHPEFIRSVGLYGDHYVVSGGGVVSITDTEGQLRSELKIATGPREYLTPMLRGPRHAGNVARTQVGGVLPRYIGLLHHQSASGDALARGTVRLHVIDLERGEIVRSSKPFTAFAAAIRVAGNTVVTSGTKPGWAGHLTVVSGDSGEVSEYAIDGSNWLTGRFRLLGEEAWWTGDDWAVRLGSDGPGTAWGSEARLLGDDATHWAWE